jgi:hypothetical protein
MGVLLWFVECMPDARTPSARRRRREAVFCLRLVADFASNLGMRRRGSPCGTQAIHIQASESPQIERMQSTLRLMAAEAKSCDQAAKR